MGVKYELRAQRAPCRNAVEQVLPSPLCKSQAPEAQQAQSHVLGLPGVTHVLQFGYGLNVNPKVTYVGSLVSTGVV